MPERPRVVMNVGASVDGKVTLTREQTLMQQPSGRLWADTAAARTDPLQPDFFELVRQEYGCTATLEGSGSLVPAGSEPAPLPRCTIDPAVLYESFLPPEIVSRPSPPRTWFTAVDGRGRVRWVEQHTDWDVLVLVCRSTPADYLGYLRAEGICYLVAGEDRVDLAAALTAMATEVGIRCVLSTAGGGLNGALVRAGLIDELTLTVHPVLIGGSDTPSVLDGPSLAVGEAPTPLRLLSVHADVGGTLHLRYEVLRTPSADPGGDDAAPPG